MSKLFAMKKRFLKSNQQITNTRNTNTNLLISNTNNKSSNNSKQDISQLIQENTNNNNNTSIHDEKTKLNNSILNNLNDFENLKNFPSINNCTPLNLPKIQNKNIINNESSLFKLKTIKIKHQINSSNSSKNIHNSLFATKPKKNIKRDKTQIDIMKGSNEMYSEINNDYVNYINNNKYNPKTNIFKMNINNNNKVAEKKKEVNNITNINIHIFNDDNKVINNIFPRNFTKKIDFKKNNEKKNHCSSSIENNKNITFCIAGNIIVSKNITTNKNKSMHKTKSLPDINTSNISNNILNDKENNEFEKLILNDEIKNIENSKNKFLIEINNNNFFSMYLKIFQIHIEICLTIKKIDFSNDKNNIPDVIIFRLANSINNFFNILSLIFKDDLIDYNNNLRQKNIFNYQILNNLFSNLIKSQICLFSSVLISIRQLGNYDFATLLKNYFIKILKEISNAFIIFYEYFIKDELLLLNNEFLSQNFFNEFNQNYQKFIEINDKISVQNYKEKIIKIISHIKQCINSLKYYSAINLKYSLIKPYGDALNQLLFSFDRKNLNEFVIIFINTILYGELELNKKYIINENKINTPSNNPNFSFINNSNNNINDEAPFLSPINPKYKYTLVLDMDETMIHFFFTYVSGIFFIRPYCFYFLNELNKYYEIGTFTAGTKEYADNILNLLDADNKIFKFRLYRQHTTIIGLNVFKDLNKLGRDLTKIIIIDNLKENFKLQQNNGLLIKTWTSDVNDNQFFDLTRVLKEIALLDVKDVRPIIQKINEDIQVNRNIINPYSNVNVGKIVNSLNSL